jgi:PPK2 family polyphosphate:nucleotide phosphotransferase
MPHHPSSPFQAVPGQAFTLADCPTLVDHYESKDAAEDAALDHAKDIEDLAHRLYAEADRKLLVVLQGMDTSGKDGTTKAVFDRTPPLNVGVAAFKSPSKKDLAHDYLWRVHKVVPANGQITVFNRSHYEDVLIVKVRNFMPAAMVEQRYAQINDFERMLTETGTTILKCMLHISHEVQGDRLRDRLDTPDKRWKFNPDDLDDRKLWPEYMDAYETMVQRTSTAHAPWYIIPSDHKPTRKAIVADLVRETLEAMNPTYPDPGYRPEDFEV